jgi:rod shape-determining protein MreC
VVHDSRRTRIVLGVLLVAALALITLDARDGGSSPVRGLRSVGGAVFGSAEYLVSVVTHPVSDFLTGLGGSPDQGKVSALERQLVQMRAELSQARLSKTESAQLQSLLQLAGRGGYRVVAANVVASGPSYEESVTIDAGSTDGVQPNETVLNGTGLVGEVTSVGSRTSTVLLDTDASATVGVRVAGTGEIGVVTGSGKNRSGPAALELQVFDENAVLRPGQQLVTFGSVNGRPYVPGVPVGVITRVQASPSALTKTAWVRPFADDGTLGVVGVVIVPPRHNPRDSVLPHPPPTPAPTHSPTPHATPTTGGTGNTGATPTPGGAGQGAGG